METKVELRLTSRSVAGTGEDINHWIEALYTGLRAGAAEAASKLFEKWQKKVIDQALGMRYKRRKKRTDTPWECRCCGNRREFRRKGKRVRSRKMVSQAGVIIFALYQVQCMRCGRVFAPVLDVWRLRPYQRYSEECLYRIIQLAIEMSYRKASRVMKLASAVSVHESTVKRWVGRLGARCPLRACAAAPVLLADSTKVKAGVLDRGEIIQVALGWHGRGQAPVLMGMDVGKDWKPLLEEIKTKGTKLLVSDGDDYIASAVKSLEWTVPVQRCRWHMGHQARHYLFRDGLPAKQHSAWIRRTNRIAFSKKKTAQQQWNKLIKDLYHNGYRMTAGYFKNSSTYLWTHRSFKKSVPTTTSLVERVMREINRRTDVGVRWSVLGVKNILNLYLGCRYQHHAWKNLWPFIKNTNNINVEVQLLNVNT